MKKEKNIEVNKLIDTFLNGLEEVEDVKAVYLTVIEKRKKKDEYGGNTSLRGNAKLIGINMVELAMENEDLKALYLSVASAIIRIMKEKEDPDIFLKFYKSVQGEE